MKKFSAFLCAFAVSLSLFSCGDSGSQNDGSGHMYDASLLYNPKSLDPQFADDPSSNTVNSNLYSGLMKLDGSGSVVCDNALSYDISDDGLIYTFQLRQDNYWFFDTNDNDRIDDDEYFPVTAKDYAFAFQRLLDPQMQSPHGEKFTCISGGEKALKGEIAPTSIGVTAPDDDTLIIQLEYPSAEFLRLLTLNSASPCNEEFFFSTKGRYGLDDKSVMSNGAFFVRQWFFDPYGSNNILYMRRNSVNSSDENRTYPSYLSFSIEESEGDISALLKDRKIDCLTTLSSSAYSKRKYNITSERSLTLGLIFNPDDQTCSNFNLRKALAYSIDKTYLAENISSDITVASGLIPPAVSLLGRSYRDLVSDKSFADYNPDLAVTFLNEAKSVLNVPSLGTVKLLVSTDTIDSGYLHMITQHWQEVLGFYIGIEEVTSTEFNQRLASGDYQMALYPLTASYNSCISLIDEYVSCKYINATDSTAFIADNLKKCAEASQLSELLSDAERKLLDEYCFIPLFYKNCYLVSGDENEDIIYDSFTGAIDFKIAKNYE